MVNSTVLSPRSLGAARAVLAVGSFVAPVAVVRAFGADTATAARVTWLTRMLAVRDAALAVGTARACADSVTWLLGGAVSDAVDAAVVGLAMRSGRLRGPLPAAIVAGGAASAVAHVGAAAQFRQLRRRG